MKVRALCWVNCGGWHRAGEVFDVEDPSALPGLVEPVEDENTVLRDGGRQSAVPTLDASGRQSAVPTENGGPGDPAPTGGDEETDSSAPANASAQNDTGGPGNTAPTEDGGTDCHGPEGPRNDSEKTQKTVKKRGRKA